MDRQMPLQVICMQPLIILASVFTLLIVPLGWWTALRIALAAMFLLTASAHWGKRRADLIRMAPAVFSRLDLLVTITGICEIAGAIGLLIPGLASIAAIGLALLLIAIFPANVAARHGIAIAGRAPTPPPVRAAIQVIFVFAVIGVAVGGRP
jgi:uncharacterized membrane protein